MQTVQAIMPQTPYYAGMSPSTQNIDLEQRDRNQFVDKMCDLIQMFKSNGISEEGAVNLAIAFYNDPRIKLRRKQRSANAKKKGR